MKKIFVILLGTFLLACEQTAPFVDMHRSAGEVKMRGQSTPDRPAICYNPLWSDQKLVEQLAEDECKKTDRHAVYSDTSWFSCCLIIPSTAFYKCEKR